ncbi:MAG: RNA-directed DNA polymerase [Coriobacteriales bacterium]|jgi:retron-type reverse transcriptase|nr:RNA-directed DNA polymerase [Coriobacteriales bacterium]
MMPGYEQMTSFENLYWAHRAARRSKRYKREVISFELRLSENLIDMQNQMLAQEYRPGDYQCFTIYEPKERLIYAPSYRDRVVQHCLCDNILAPMLDRRLIYDNSACRFGKGTHFSLYRLSDFMRRQYKESGTRGYFLKCDIAKYFENINHSVLLTKLRRVFSGAPLLEMLGRVIDSYQSAPGRGLPLGNQASQWFAIYYLDSLDRLVKERLGIRWYTRYMDDFILIHADRGYLKECLAAMTEHIEGDLGLRFNAKTQIHHLTNGINYLGFHLYLTDSGRVLRRLTSRRRAEIRKALEALHLQHDGGMISERDFQNRLASYRGHLKHGHEQGLMKLATYKATTREG